MNNTIYQRFVFGNVFFIFRPGSVISSFNVTYPGIDSLQIVSLQEEITGGALGETSAELLNITAANGT